MARLGYCGAVVRIIDKEVFALTTQQFFKMSKEEFYKEEAPELLQAAVDNKYTYEEPIDIYRTLD